MTHRRTLLVLAFATCFLLSAAPRVSAQDFCPEVVGMSACDESAWSTWADCMANDYLQQCLADNPCDQECYSNADQIWQNEYRTMSKGCDYIAQECALIGGTRNASGGCTPPPASGGGTIADSGGGTTTSCHQEYIYVDVDYGDGDWVTVWEGWATVCG